MRSFPFVRLAAWAAVCCLLVLGRSAVPLQAQPGWTPLGPFGGHVGSVTVDPRDSRVLYAAGTLPGVLKSTDGGTSWRLLPGSPALSAVTLAPARPTTIYAISTFEPSLIFRGDDGGARWTRIGRRLPPELQLLSLDVDPARPARLYLRTQNQGLWRSEDGGASWKAINRGLPDPRTAQVTAFAAGPRGTAFAGTEAGVFRTRDAGASWTLLRRGLPAGSAVALGIAPSDERTVYAAFRGGLGIYRSDDGGERWAPAGNPAPPDVRQATFAVDPRSPRAAYFAAYDSGLFKTTDGGAHWALTPSLSHRVTSLALDPQAPATVYAGAFALGLDPGGVLRSADGGGSWARPNRGIAGLQANAAAVDPGNSNLLLAAMNGGGLFRSTDRGARWLRTPVGLPVTSIFGAVILQAIATEPGVFYAVTAGSGPRLWKSADSGATWSPLPDPGVPLQSVRADPAEPDVLYALGFAGGPSKALFHSGDGGATWTRLPDVPFICENVDLTVARASTATPAVLYLTGARPGPCQSAGRTAFYRSSDAGATWSPIVAGLPGPAVTALAVDPADPLTLYAAVSSNSGLPFGVWKSSDGGEHWERAGELPSQSITALGVSPVPGRLYVASASGLGKVYRSDDFGATWRDWSGGLSVFLIHDFIFDPNRPGRVYAVTSGGVWALENRP